MVTALQNKQSIDQFVVYTDNETWSGNIHPAQALNQYREKMNPNAQMAMVGMTSTGFSIADPEDSGMLDVVGFDTATPEMLAMFARHEL